MDILAEAAKIKEVAATLESPLPISEGIVKIAWKARKSKPKSKENTFVLVACLSLLNAAIKNPAFTKPLNYAGIKPSVTYLVGQLISDSSLVDDFWIDPVEKNCVYIETYGFQFTFHRVLTNAKMDAFIASKTNIIKPWAGIRLQRIAEEIFLLAMRYRIQQQFNQTDSVG